MTRNSFMGFIRHFPVKMQNEGKKKEFVFVEDRVM